MTASLRCRSARVLGPAGAVVVSSLLFGSIGLADHSVSEGTSSGDVHKGKMYVPLLWSASLSPETFSVAVPGNCQGTVDLTMKWDEEEDFLKIRLKGKNVLTPHPTVHRTPGVDFFPNAFWPEAEDIIGGRYQLWFISPSEEFDFYYDGSTLDLLGSEHDFATPPAGSIPVHVPGIKVLGSEFFQPQANGDLDVEFTWSYSGLVRLDRPEFSHMFVSFPPHNLCESNPFRYDLSTTRGYISEPRPASEARPFPAYFKNGIIFQITVEPPSYFVEPPRDTQTAVYNNATGIGGLIPRGYTFDIDAFFMNVAPPIKPFPLAGQCVNYFSGVHTQNLNFCGP
jgi:hypothetical protein